MNADQELSVDERVEIESALAGVDYPAPRNKLIETARINRAPRRVLERLLRLPETADFQDAEALHRAMGVAVPGVRPEGGWQ